MRALASAAGLAVASAALGLWVVWPDLGEARERYAGLDATAADLETVRDTGLDPAAFTFFRRHVQPDDAYYVLPTSGPSERTLVVRSLAWYWLVPARQVDELAEADIVLSYGAASLPEGAAVRSGPYAVVRLAP